MFIQQGIDQWWDTSKQFSLIHNGIIENYIPLKKFLEQKGVEFHTQTDTEVLIQFISYMHDKESDAILMEQKEIKFLSKIGISNPYS